MAPISPIGTLRTIDKGQTSPHLNTQSQLVAFAFSFRCHETKILRHLSRRHFRGGPALRNTGLLRYMLSDARKAVLSCSTENEVMAFKLRTVGQTSFSTKYQIRMEPKMAYPLLSVIITNYNYDKFVSIAIESLRSQAMPVEIIVVDDCSTDESRHILANYEPPIKIILKDKNLGHGDGFNQGFAASTGDTILFLDADDFMLPEAVQILADTFDAKSALNVYRMHYADAEGRTFGLFPPLEAPLTQGSAVDLVLQKGSIHTTVTSGMVYPRWVLEKVLPVPVEQFRQGADGYLASVVPLYGTIKVHDNVITAYRQHRTQHSKFLREYASRARWCIEHNQARYAAIYAHAEKLGKTANADLASADVDNLQQRLISLLFEPELHPITTDKLGDLTQRIIELQRAAPASLTRTLKILWWRLLSIVNIKTRKTLLSWQVDPLTRPAWLGALGRLLRTRLKVTV